MSDLLHQNFATVQSNQQPLPATIAAATTVAPTTGLTFISGTGNITDVTPPVTGYHMLVFIFTNANPGDFTTTGNILVATTTIPQNVPVLLFYDPAQGGYYTAQLTA